MNQVEHELQVMKKALKLGPTRAERSEDAKKRTLNQLKTLLALTQRAGRSRDTSSRDYRRLPGILYGVLQSKFNLKKSDKVLFRKPIATLEDAEQALRKLSKMGGKATPSDISREMAVASRRVRVAIVFLMQIRP